MGGELVPLGRWKDHAYQFDDNVCVPLNVTRDGVGWPFKGSSGPGSPELE